MVSTSEREREAYEDVAPEAGGCLLLLLLLSTLAADRLPATSLAVPRLGGDSHVTHGRAAAAASRPARGEQELFQPHEASLFAEQASAGRRRED